MEAMQEEIAQALTDPTPGAALRRILEDQVKAGTAREWLLAELDSTADRLGEEGRTADENLVLDAMDALSGYCHPSARI